MPVIGSAAAQEPARPIRVRDIGPEDLRAALTQGLDDFNELRGHLLLLGFIYPIVGLLVATFALRNALLPMLFPLVAGIALLGPAVASGFYELARRRERGDDIRWRHFFDVFRGRSFASIVALTLVLALLFVAWLGAAWAIYAETLGGRPPASVGEFARQLFTTADGWRLIILGNLAGLAFATLVLTISVVSFPLLVDRPVGVGVAVATSVRAVRRNPGMIALWGVIVAALLFLGSVPLFVGLAVVLPVLGYATWHLYTRLVES